MKKILFLVTSSEYGGAQKYVFDLAVNLPQTDYRVIVAAGQGDGELFSRLANFPSVKTVKLFNLKRLPEPLTAQRCVKEIIKLLNEERPDILHLNSTVAGCLGSRAAKIYKKKTKTSLKVIYTVHGWVFLEPGFVRSKICFLAEKISARWKDLFIVLSEKDRQIGLAKKIAPAEKIIKIYNGINISTLHFLPPAEAKKILSTGEQEKTKAIVGTIANFYATKGLNFLIKAIALIKKNHQLPPVVETCSFTTGQAMFNLLIIGDGPERKKLKNLITKLKLNDRVFLTGRIPQAHQYLKAFDIFCLPSVKEGFPFVILEAMSAEIPIIATTVGAVPEILKNEKSGILVQPKNPQTLANAIQELLNNPQKQKSLAHKAKQRITKFSLSQMLSQTYQLYNSLNYETPRNVSF